MLIWNAVSLLNASREDEFKRGCGYSLLQLFLDGIQEEQNFVFQLLYFCQGWQTAVDGKKDCSEWNGTGSSKDGFPVSARDWKQLCLEKYGEKKDDFKFSYANN